MINKLTSPDVFPVSNPSFLLLHPLLFPYVATCAAIAALARAVWKLRYDLKVRSGPLISSVAAVVYILLLFFFFQKHTYWSL